MKLNKAFALRVREVLKEKKMTQYKLAQETGLYHSTMTDILNCKYKTSKPRSLPWGYEESKESCKKFKEKCKEVFSGAIRYVINTFLTGMAEGFDMIGAEILIELRKTQTKFILKINLSRL